MKARGKARFRAVLKTISVALGSSEQILRPRGIAGTRLLLRVLRT
jgi:hypothetical protein